ncbi:hypothetical protein GCM10009787_50710 [Streptomyces bangladeshensis]|uniref:Uncharacterized protein n=1 Tax=Streptomyces bangladeshensis TaxID=295352 RepID=A0ABN3BTW5_9ACTN
MGVGGRGIGRRSERTGGGQGGAGRRSERRRGPGGTGRRKGAAAGERADGPERASVVLRVPRCLERAPADRPETSPVRARMMP